MQEGVEYIFINDCTPDHSIEILNEILKEYSNNKSTVRIINNEHNMGITSTRKIGIKSARGEYVAWVDSDDWVDNNWLSSMYEATQDGSIDIVIQNITRHIFHGNNVKLSEHQLYSVESPQRALELFYTERHIPRGLPMQMSRLILIQEAIKNVSEVNYSEDTFTLLYLFLYAQSAVWLEKSYYHYRKINNGQSLTMRNYKTRQEWLLQKKNIDSICNILDNHPNKKQYRITSNYIKWRWKVEFKPVFDFPYEYWNEYKEAYKYICIYTIPDSNIISKIVTWLCVNIYPLFHLRLFIKRGSSYYNSI